MPEASGREPRPELAGVFDAILSGTAVDHAAAEKIVIFGGENHQRVLAEAWIDLAPPGPPTGEQCRFASWDPLLDSLSDGCYHWTMTCRR